MRDLRHASTVLTVRVTVLARQETDSILGRPVDEILLVVPGALRGFILCELLDLGVSTVRPGVSSPACSILGGDLAYNIAREEDLDVRY